MSNAIPKEAKRLGDWTRLNHQLAEAKALLRELRQTVADIEDARTIEHAKRANGKKARIPWADVKRELDLG